MALVTVSVITDNSKLFDSMQYVDTDIVPEAASVKLLDKMLEKFRSRKVVPPTFKPRISFEKCSEIPGNALEFANNYVIVYNKPDYEQLRHAVNESGNYGAFIVCVDDNTEADKVSQLFADSTAVDIITRSTVDKTEDFSRILVHVMLKRALREAGFL